MKKKLKRSFSVFLAGICLIFSCTVTYAQEKDLNVLNKKTEKMITEIEEQYGINRSYFDDIVEMYFDNGYTDCKELNIAIQDAAKQMMVICEKTEAEYQDAFVKYQANISDYNNTTYSINPVYSTAMNLYRTGISIVQNANCPETARSMEHAIVPESAVGTGWTPGRLHYDDVSWSKFLITTQEFWQKMEGQFQYQLGLGKDVITFSGSHAFTQANSSLDAYVQLHNVNYSVTFVKKPGGSGYTGNVLISDIYDFDWTNYDNFVIGFANNYCKAVQDAGFIAPYPIYVSGKL